MIKSFKSIIVSVLASVAVFAADAESTINASINAGYNNHYIVNGLSKTENSAIAGFGISNSYRGIDVYVGGEILPDSNGIDESHWKIGVAKTFSVVDGFGLRFDAQALRHQSSIVGGRNSIEISPKISITNAFVTPYVRGSHDFNLDQSGFVVGVERAIGVFNLFTVTPVVEYGKFSDYEMMSAKVGVSRTFYGGQVQPYAEVGWYNNNLYNTKYNIATREFNNDVVVTAGVRWHF